MQKLEKKVSKDAETAEAEAQPGSEPEPSVRPPKKLEEKLQSNACSAALCVYFLPREELALLFQTFSISDPPEKAPRRAAVLFWGKIAQFRRL